MKMVQSKLCQTEQWHAVGYFWDGFTFSMPHSSFKPIFQHLSTMLGCEMYTNE